MPCHRPIEMIFAFSERVTKATPLSGFLFVRFGEIVHAHPFAKFQVSMTRLGNMFEGLPNFIRVI